MHTLRQLLGVSIALITAAGAGMALRRGISESHAEPESLRSPEWMIDWRELERGGIPTGDSSAPVHIVEFIDLQCPVCKIQHEALKKAVKRFGSQLTVRYIHLPLPNHPFSMSAAQAAECAAEQDRFEPFMDEVFSTQDSLGALPWDAYARRAGRIDSLLFDRCLTNSATLARVSADLAIGKRHQVAMTPTLVVNGWRFSGLVQEATLNDVISRIAAGQLPAGASAQRIAQEPFVQARRFGQRERSMNRMVVGPVPYATTSTGDPDFDLTNVSDVALLSDGRVVTYTVFGSRLLVFGPDGRGERRIGRSGRGPGELQRAANMSRGSGDSILLLDGANAKVVTATAVGGVVREQSLDAGTALLTDRIASTLPGGGLVLYQSVRRPPPPSERRIRASLPVVLIRPDTGAREITSFPGAEFARIETRYRGRARTEAVRVRLSGTPHVTVFDSLVVTAPGPRFRIEFRDRKGTLLGSLEDTTPRRVVTGAMKRSVIESELQRLTAPGAERLIDPKESERIAREAPFADTLGAIHALHVSPDDHVLWVVDAIAPGDMEWTALGVRRDGSISGTLRGVVSKGIPVSFRAGRVALLYEDSDGANRVATYPIVPAKR